MRPPVADHLKSPMISNRPTTAQILSTPRVGERCLITAGPEEEWELRKNYRHFIVDEKKMALTNDGLFSHCLPLRRNIKATDGVMDAPYCLAMDEAENRLHVQKALMMNLLGAEL